MAPEKIVLPDFLLADLYKNTIVEPAAKSTRAKPAVTQALPKEIAVLPKLATLGQNAKNVTVVVNDKTTTVISDSDLAFLTNILKACNLAITDIAIVNRVNEAFDFNRLKLQLKPAFVLMFDVDTTELQLPFLIPLFQRQKFDGVTILIAPPLSKMAVAGNESRQLKGKLWLALKEVFNIA